MKRMTTNYPGLTQGEKTVLENCRRHGMQSCHICPDGVCCDNANLKAKTKEEQEAVALLEEARRVVSNLEELLGIKKPVYTLEDDPFVGAARDQAKRREEETPAASPGVEEACQAFKVTEFEGVKSEQEFLRCIALGRPMVVDAAWWADCQFDDMEETQSSLPILWNHDEEHDHRHPRRWNSPALQLGDYDEMAKELHDAHDHNANPNSSISHLNDEIKKLREENEQLASHNPHSPDCEFFQDAKNGFDEPRGCTCAVKLNARIKQLEGDNRLLNEQRNEWWTKVVNANAEIDRLKKENQEWVEAGSAVFREKDEVLKRTKRVEETERGLRRVVTRVHSELSKYVK